MLGILVQSFMRFPGFPPFPVVSTVRPLAVMKGLWAFERNAVLVVLLAIGVVELTIGRQVRPCLNVLIESVQKICRQNLLKIKLCEWPNKLDTTS